jgi:hypothetical protein
VLNFSAAGHTQSAGPALSVLTLNKISADEWLQAAIPWLYGKLPARPDSARVSLITE